MVDPLVGSSLISAGGSLLGGIFGSSSAKKAAQAQMAFQREVLQNQHQWEVSDLRAAGLNPVLSANHGAGSASGAMSNEGQIIADALTGATGSALDAATKSEQARTQKAETAAKEATVENLKAQTVTNKATTQKLLADAAVSAQDARIAKSRADFEANLSPRQREASWLLDQVGKVTGSAQDAGNTAGALKRTKTPVIEVRPRKR